MKILELTNYSAGSCGVFARVKKEAVFLTKQGHHVKIFSSYFEKGTNKVMPSKDLIEGVEITRFPATNLGGESFMHWNCLEEAINFKPDVIIAHGYRHRHTHLALKIAKIVGAKCFLVTHAPFTMSTRSPLAKLAVSFYDSFVAPRLINKFDKVISITQWEVPYLLKLGCKKEKIAYIPNGIQDEFFDLEVKSGKGVFFLGRVSPIKNIELLIEAVKGQKIKVDVVGPAEEEYKQKLLSIIEEEGIKNVRFLPEITDLKEKIDAIDKYEVLVLPSNFESFGQVLIEAMARGKIVISSKTPGGSEIIQDKKNGFLFDVGSAEQLKKVILSIKKMPAKKKNIIRKEARKRAEDFKMSKELSNLLSLL